MLCEHYGLDGNLETVSSLSRITKSAITWALSLRVVRAGLLYVERRGPALADGITYRALFSVFAGVLLGFSVAGLWLSGNPAALDALVSSVNAAIPGLLGPDGLIKVSSIEIPVGLSLAGLASLAGLIGAALGAIGSLRIALRTLASTLTDDTFWLWVILRNLALAVAIGVAFALSAVLAALGDELLGFITDNTAISATSAFSEWAATLSSIVLVFVLDAALIAAIFVTLSGVKAPARALWTGALLGAAGLVVLQQLSNLFIGGAKNNPLLATFASLIALLLWLNLSAQVMLYASAFIITWTEDAKDAGVERPRTFAQRRLRSAERTLVAAYAERKAALEAVREEVPKAEQPPRAEQAPTAAGPS